MIRLASFLAILSLFCWMSLARDCHTCRLETIVGFLELCEPRFYAIEKYRNEEQPYFANAESCKRKMSKLTLLKNKM